VRKIIPIIRNTAILDLYSTAIDDKQNLIMEHSSKTMRPAFNDLPLRKGDPPYSAWTLWGDDDELGTLVRKLRESWMTELHLV